MARTPRIPTVHEVAQGTLAACYKTQPSPLLPVRRHRARALLSPQFHQAPPTRDQRGTGDREGTEHGCCRCREDVATTTTRHLGTLLLLLRSQTRRIQSWWSATPPSEPRARTASSSPTVGTATPTLSPHDLEKLSEDPDKCDYFDSTPGHDSDTSLLHNL
ncbi:LOW QUALITY PROTEIN: hypothetical protein U9M48_042539 [Paspalum notatum var. saurae]|uniref:Uncharacterized protein n=1 Tax=Paspalum notatum var. saurae TaxID=547442 RepID=A0AAQ3UST1_PASNO